MRYKVHMKKVGKIKITNIHQLNRDKINYRTWQGSLFLSHPVTGQSAHSVPEDMV